MLRNLALAFALLAQDGTPVVPPAPPPITVTATEQVNLGEPVRISVATGGTGLLVRVRQILPGEDLDVSANLLDLEGPAEFAFTHRSPGGYLIEAQAIVGEKIETAYAYSRIGPVAPGPDPDPDPDPEPTPGPKHVLIIHESGDTTPQFGQLVTQLRTGANAKYLADNKHRLWILDDDLQGEMAKWLTIVGSTKLPVIVISEPDRGASGAIVVELPKTADAVMELIKKAD